MTVTSRNVLVIAETRYGKLRQVSLEALTAARTIAGPDGTVTAWIAGADPSDHAKLLADYGADRVLSAADPQAEPYNPERMLSLASQAVSLAAPSAIVLGHTAVGKDLAPRLAAQLNAGQISDVIAIESEVDGAIRFTRPIYAGKAFEKRMFRTEPWVVTIRPNNFAAPVEAADGGVEANIEEVTADPAQDDIRTTVLDIVKRTTGRTDLSEAKVVVSGGRGVKSADGFQPLAELAAVLNGAVGASRGACDAGYCDYALQIGQTGKVVTPELYIACGISGAIQHLAGMSQSRVIVAINKDPEAPIFKIADYGIVGDLFEVVPLLTAEFKRLLSPQ